MADENLKLPMGGEMNGLIKETNSIGYETPRDEKGTPNSVKVAAGASTPNVIARQEPNLKALSTRCPNCESEVHVQFGVALQLGQCNTAIPQKSVYASNGVAPDEKQSKTAEGTSEVASDGEVGLGFAELDENDNLQLVEAAGWKKALQKDPFRTQDETCAVVMIRRIRKSPLFSFYRSQAGDANIEEMALLSPGLLTLFRRTVANYPGIRMESKRIVLKRPYEPLFFYMDTIRGLAAQQPEIAGKDFASLEHAYDKFIRADHAQIWGLISKNIIDYTSLWAIFKPGDCIYCLGESGLPQLRILAAVQYREPEPIFALNDNEVSSERKFPRLCVDMWSIGWDTVSERFQRFVVTQSIRQFTGTCEVKALPFYPLKYLDGGSEEQIEIFCQAQRRRGNLWRTLLSEPPSCRLYHGPVFLPNWHDATITHERVMVDESPKVQPPYKIHGGNRSMQDEARIEKRPGRLMSGFARSRHYAREAPVLPVGYPDEFSEFDDFDPQCNFSDLQAQLCPPTVRCYGLTSGKTFQADVARLTQIEWETSSLGYLELDEGKKRTICSLVERHKKNSDKIIKDIIPNKGKGLVIVLHGPPGVGKTLTAETMAEYTRKPLLPINIGELIGDSNLVGCLRDVFYLAARWDAILLLDEADVLLEKRSYEDLKRNGLVSIFLRMLEYFEGILFMTTNRIETMDLAFQSRVHIAVRYESLTLEKRRRIWEGFIDRLDDREQEAKSELRERLDDIQTWDLNGRQIRNVLSIAESSALNTQRRRGALRYHHVETVANETLYFQDFFEVSSKQRKSQVADLSGRQFQERRSRQSSRLS